MRKFVQLQRCAAAVYHCTENVSIVRIPVRLMVGRDRKAQRLIPGDAFFDVRHRDADMVESVCRSAHACSGLFRQAADFQPEAKRADRIDVIHAGIVADGIAMLQRCSALL